MCLNGQGTHCKCASTLKVGSIPTIPNHPSPGPSDLKSSNPIEPLLVPWPFNNYYFMGGQIIQLSNTKYYLKSILVNVKASPKVAARGTLGHSNLECRRII